jgi:hypothetical protein
MTPTIVFFLKKKTKLPRLMVGEIFTSVKGCVSWEQMYWVQEAEQGTEMEGIVWQCAATVSLFHS